MKSKSRVLMILLALVMIFGTVPSAVSADSQDSQAKSADAPAADVSQEAEDLVSSGDIEEDQVIVVFKEGVSESKAETICENNDVEVQDVTSLDGQRAVLAELGDGQSVAEAITEINKEKKVDFVQPNFRYKLQTKDPYDKNLAGSQWYLWNTRAKQAAAALADVSGSKVKVAVIDTGVDIDHEDLQKNLNKKLSVELDHKGGYTKLNDDKDEHGTHVSGIIAATYNNGKGIAGVSSLGGNKVTDLFVVDASQYAGMGGYFDSFDLACAVRYITDKGAKVMSMSVGGNGRDRYMERAFEYAYRNDVVLVAASGNSGIEIVETPSDFDCVISVCSTTKDNTRSYFSSIGQPKDIAAPGTSIISTVPGDRYAVYSGTSMATPIVAAAAAEVRFANPSLTNAQVRNILCATADGTIGDNPEGFDKGTGYGLVNIEAAVKAALSASADIAPESVSVKPGSEDVTLARQDTCRVNAVVLPANSLAEVTYESSDESIATVDETGLVTAVKTGTAVITARAGEAAAEMTVHVSGQKTPEQVIVTDVSGEPVTGEVVIPSDASVSYYPEIYLDAKVLPGAAANKNEIAWESSDMSVVTVDEYGMLIGHKPGKATVTAAAYNGVSASVTVRVAKAASSVKFTAKKQKIKLGKTKTFTYKATASPSNAADQAVFWKSSNRKTAAIGKNTGKLTVRNTGQTTITGYTLYGASKGVRLTVYKTSYKASAYKLKAKAGGKKAIKLTWKKIPNADGYHIFRYSAAKKKFVKIKAVAGSKTSFKDTKLAKNKKYRYKVRAFYTTDKGSKDWCRYSQAASARTAK